jgi:N-acyl-L-homoserine lactone synthetase
LLVVVQAKEQVLGAIRLLPRNEAHLLTRTAAALQL